MLEARLADCDVRALIVDLDVADVAMQMLARVKSKSGADGKRDGGRDGEREICVLAFGPHVARDELVAAREAGADEVMTRGAFDHAIERVLVRLAGAGR